MNGDRTQVPGLPLSPERDAMGATWKVSFMFLALLAFGAAVHAADAPVVKITGGGRGMKAIAAQ